LDLSLNINHGNTVERCLSRYLQNSTETLAECKR
jgi:hypothetical protein